MAGMVPHTSPPASVDQSFRHSPIVELRRYTLHPGRRDDLITLFDAHFVESQEACGMKIIGQFRDIEEPDAFVWLRGFDSMEPRHKALTDFYDGPVWAAHRDAANATMIDSDDVLLLHPVGDSGGFTLPNVRPVPDSTDHSPAIIQALTYPLRSPAEDGFLAFYDERIAPILRASGDKPVAAFASEHGENTFTRLPVRVGENVLVVFSRFEDAAACSAHNSALASAPEWIVVQQWLTDNLSAPPTTARLLPTVRSLLR